MKTYYPAVDRTPDLLNQGQTCYRLSQRGELDVEKLPHAVVRRKSLVKCRDSCDYHTVQSGSGTVGLFLFQKMEHLVLQKMKT